MRKIIFTALMIVSVFGYSQTVTNTLYPGDHYILDGLDVSGISNADTSFVYRIYGGAWSFQGVFTQAGGSGDITLQVSNGYDIWENYSDNATDTFDGTDTTFFYEDTQFVWKYLKVKIDSINGSLDAWLYIK